MAQRWDEQLAGNEQLAGQGVSGSRPFDSSIAGGQLTKSDRQRARRWLIAAGVIAVINGIVAIAVPVLASVAISILIGWVLLVAGIALGMQAVSHRSLLRALDAALALIA